MAYLRSGASTATSSAAAKESNGDAAATSGEQTRSSEAARPVGRMTMVIFVGLLIDLLAFTLILPLFPALLDHYRKNDPDAGLYQALDAKVKAFGSYLGSPEQFNSVLFGGLIGSLFSFLQFVASPLIGGMSDLFGRRPLLLLSTAGVAASYAVWAAASSFKIFVIARIVGGLSKGNVSLATAIVTDDSTPKTRGKGMALVGIAFSIGFIVGPIIGAVFSIWGRERADNWFVYPAYCALALSLLDLAFIAAFFEETLPQKQRLKSFSAALKQAAVYVNPISLFRFASLSNLSARDHSALQTQGLVYFVYLFLYSGLEFTLTFLTHNRFNFTSMQQGKMFLFIGVVMAAVQGGYVRRIAPGKEKAMALRGLLLIVPSFAVVGFAYSLPMLYFGLFLYAVSTAICVPCMTTMVSSYGDTSQKGIIMGVYRSLGALARAIGPMVAATFYWVAGPELCYCAGGLGLLVPYLMLKKIDL